MVAGVVAQQGVAGLSLGADAKSSQMCNAGRRQEADVNMLPDEVGGGLCNSFIGLTKSFKQLFHS